MGVFAGQNANSQGWFLVYQWRGTPDNSSLAYEVDNSGSAPSFTRVLYTMAYGKFHVWCEFDDFTSSTATRTGLPTGWTYEVDVTNMNVYVNNPEQGFPGATQSAIKDRKGVTGRLNFWPSNYGASGGNSSLYDHDDAGYSTSDGYGSMQIFSLAESTPETVFAYNRWGYSPADIGMGSRDTGHPDWTFAQNSNDVAAGAGVDSSKFLYRSWVK